MFKFTRKILLMVVLLIGACIPSGIASASLYNPNTDWFMNAKYGVFNTWLYGYGADMTGDWNTIVNNFDVNAYANQAALAGVGYVMFSLGQNSGYYCSPNATYNYYTGYTAGQRTSIRDLPMDLANALSPKGIKLILYIPGNPPNGDQQARNGFDWPGANGYEYAPSQSTMHKWQDGVIKEWSDRYGSKVAGWWVDGMWYQSSYNDMTKAQNWSTFANDLKSGNPNRIIAFNPSYYNGVIKNSDYEDYTAGEQGVIGALPPSGRWLNGIQWQVLTFMGDTWGGSGLNNTTSDLVNWVKNVTDRQGVVTLDIKTSKTGVWDASQMDQLMAVKNVVRNGGIVSGKTYEILGLASNRSLDAYGGGTANGTSIKLWDYNNTNNQKWIITDVGGGAYKIIGAASGRGLDVSGGGTTNGTGIQLWDYNNTNNQKWNIIDVGGGNYKIISVASGRGLDAAGAGTANGTGIQLWDYAGGNNQKWKLIKLN